MYSVAIRTLRPPLFLLGLLSTVVAQTFDVPWSDIHYGPDGPWQAVMVTLGGNDSDVTIAAQNFVDAVDMYPGGSYDSFAFAQSACQPFRNQVCGAGGTWEPDSEALELIPSNGWHPSINDEAWGWKTAPINYTRRGMTIFKTTVWNVSISHADAGNITYPNGQVGGMTLGFLSLGADDKNQIFTLSDQMAGRNISLEIFNAKLHTDGQIASYSYGLHIGSAAFNYPGSLVFGGYNKGRVIGPTTSFRDPERVDLLDIGIGVEDGDSPFDFESKSNLLNGDTGNANDAGPAVEVKIDPRNPYLSLPDKTCKMLAEILPIEYDAGLGYYLWQTQDPRFERIVTSPSYLSFTFPPGPGTADKVVIKVPFALLNLTLEAPITTKPTQYFPCVSFEPGEEDAYRLGRAFLQAAFVARNWQTKMTWLGQAPGPGFNGQGLGDQIMDMEENAVSIESWNGKDTNYFNQSWAGHWSIASSEQNSAENGGPGGSPNGGNGGNGGDPAAGGKKGGLSTGATAGIAVGAVIVGLALIGLAVFLWRRKRSAHKVIPVEKGGSDEPTQLSTEYYAHHDGDRYTDHNAAGAFAPKSAHPHELGTEVEAQELPDGNDPRFK